MRSIERACIAIRHVEYLKGANWLWDGVRPLYDQVIAYIGRNGLERIINGTDRILIAPEARDLPEQYEPDVWRSLMEEVRPGDVVADVGTFIGLYTIALAKRVGGMGRVIAFEPDPGNFSILKEHVKLNGVEEKVDLIQAAAGAKNGYVNFISRLSESHVATGSANETKENGSQKVKCITLDSIFAGQRLDLMKIDVEGYEEVVLRGASELLSDPARSPRAIYIEVHPFAWPGIGTTGESLLGFLAKFNYEARDLNSKRVERIEQYGEIVAYKHAK